MWINKAYAADQQTWRHELIRQVTKIAAKAFEVSDEEEAPTSVDVVDPRNTDRNAMNMYCICETHMLRIIMTFRYPNFSIISKNM